MKVIGMIFMVIAVFFASPVLLACEVYTVINSTQSQYTYRITFLRIAHPSEVTHLSPQNTQDLLCVSVNHSGNLLVQQKSGDDVVASCVYGFSSGVIDSANAEFLSQGKKCPGVSVDGRVITLS